jgi:hypothetical protein
MTKNQAFASHCGLDLSESREYRYHTGRTSQPVWAIDNAYYCVTKGNELPATHRDGMEWNWTEIADQHLNQYHYKIWIHETTRT